MDTRNSFITRTYEGIFSLAGEYKGEYKIEPYKEKKKKIDIDIIMAYCWAFVLFAASLITYILFMLAVLGKK